MTNDELNAALYQKMSAEFQNYRSYLLTLPPAEILDHTYEDVCCKGEFQNP